MNKIHYVECIPCGIDLYIGVTEALSESTVINVQPEETPKWCPFCKSSFVGVIVTKNIDDWKVESARLLLDGKFVAAIKHCREKTGMDLKSAKQTVEHMPEFEKIRLDREIMRKGSL